ncbi:hypothetical protein BDV93DRAFT_67214 [Ceratobasidium sp. AG-I]|nr:hypothetical protein BDV93DRAFT_67214 [Ceratobasidium sp. AG-I]
MRIRHPAERGLAGGGREMTLCMWENGIREMSCLIMMGYRRCRRKPEDRTHPSIEEPSSSQSIPPPGQPQCTFDIIIQFTPTTPSVAVPPVSEGVFPPSSTRSPPSPAILPPCQLVLPYNELFSSSLPMMSRASSHPTAPVHLPQVQYYPSLGRHHPIELPRPEPRQLPARSFTQQRHWSIH